MVPHLYEAGVSPFLVRKGDDIPVALSHVFTSSDLVIDEEMDEREVRV